MKRVKSWMGFNKGSNLSGDLKRVQSRMGARKFQKSMKLSVNVVGFCGSAS